MLASIFPLNKKQRMRKQSKAAKGDMLSPVSSASTIPDGDVLSPRSHMADYYGIQGYMPESYVRSDEDHPLLGPESTEISKTHFDALQMFLGHHLAESMRALFYISHI
jgi:hypothetical protein